MKHLCRLFQLLLFFFCVGCGSTSAADVAPELDHAFNDAVDAYTLHAAKSVGFENIDARWHSDLSVLVRSHSPEAAQMLARLGTFDLDGSLGEDYSCASSLHAREVAAQLAIDINAGYCLGLITSRHLKGDGICAPVKTIQRRISSLSSQQGSDTEVECSF
jgi:uncharacterized protein YcfL